MTGFTMILIDCVSSIEVFSAYGYKEIIPGCQPHPGDIVEAAPLAVSTRCIVITESVYEMPLKLVACIESLGGCT